MTEDIYKKYYFDSKSGSWRTTAVFQHTHTTKNQMS